VGWSTFDRKRDMSDDDKSRGRAGEKARPRVKTSSERPFDLWLQKQLHAMYDEIASEPLPTDLLNLIDRDAAKSDGFKSDGLKNNAHQEPRSKK
jgi:hypothetical protein